ncbi:MAG: HD domain-containing protein [Firmicutes bacterium]|jgi:HD superfamily phosphohydrolase|nr:HD domain-containing protein [Bacillota bacterium]
MSSVERAYRDPVHDFITLTDPMLIALIDTPEFQRLRRIRQLGASHGTYHGAEHSRFGHSLGVLWVMHKVIRRLKNQGIGIDPWSEQVAYVAALLHDIGHGPFSHALEETLTPGRNHEDWGRRIILGDTEVHRILQERDPELPGAVASVLDGTWSGPRLVRSLVSSQLDVDRMDYLLRDSLYTGVTYGVFDLERLINTLWVVDQEIVLLRKGIVAAEEYILARYFMYWQVYFHKTTRGQELLLRQVWRRAVHLAEERRLGEEWISRHLYRLLRGEADLTTYLRVDDHDVMAAVKAWTEHPDPILSDLSRRYVDRALLKSVFRVAHEEIDLSLLDEAAAVVRSAGWDPEYYLLVDRTKDVAYDYYTSPNGEEGRRKPILALDEFGRPQEIATLSHTIAAVATRRRVAVNIYVPADCVGAVRRLFAG